MNSMEPLKKKSLQFREVMNGMVAVGETDPQKGFESEGAYAASLRATIDIEDVGEFVAAGHHVGRLRAELVIPVLGGRYLSGDGEYILFGQGNGPSGRPVREMIYNAHFMNDDRVYRMRAHKILEPGWPWRLWPATTTLRVRLDDVTEQPAELLEANFVQPTFIRRDPVAAGILHLTARGFIRQLGTMHVSGDVKWFEKPFVFKRYATFFALGLAKIYLLRSRL